MDTKRELDHLAVPAAESSAGGVTIPCNVHTPQRMPDESVYDYHQRREQSKRDIKRMQAGTVLHKHRASTAKRNRRALIKQSGGIRAFKRWERSARDLEAA